MGAKGISTEYLSTGSNRQTAVADWSRGGVIAFGADVNVALWKPTVSEPPDEENHEIDNIPRLIFREE